MTVLHWFSLLVWVQKCHKTDITQFATSKHYNSWQNTMSMMIFLSYETVLLTHAGFLLASITNNNRIFRNWHLSVFPHVFLLIFGVGSSSHLSTHGFLVFIRSCRHTVCSSLLEWKAEAAVPFKLWYPNAFTDSLSWSLCLYSHMSFINIVTLPPPTVIKSDSIFQDFF